MSRSDLAALLELRMLPGVGDRRLARLLERHGSVQAALGASARQLGDAAAAARGTRRVRVRVERALEVIERLQVIVLADPAAVASGSLPGREPNTDAGPLASAEDGTRDPTAALSPDAAACSSADPTTRASAESVAAPPGIDCQPVDVDATTPASTESVAIYPARLRELHDPPVVLFARGKLELLERPIVAIVGARRHTEYGADVTRALAHELSGAGVVVISGLARGIDSIAHGGALAGGTIAVLGCGIDVVYPPENRRLHERIATEGLLLTEFAPGEPPLRHHFPRRNRLIAALARGVVVIEASARSGALITVDHALDLGRDVFAVPGPVGRRTSEGTNALIRDGAVLVSGANDILEELGIPAAAHARASTDASAADVPPSDLSGPRLALWSAMDEEPSHVDGLAAACRLGAGPALAALLELELAGYARQLPGKRFRRA